MNNNQSKQVLLSVVGIALLVVAVVGISFAFFTYSRTGATNNTLTAGKITFTFTDGTTNGFITLLNQFPITTAQGTALTGDGTCTFTISGITEVGSTINYAVYAIPGGSAANVNTDRGSTVIDTDRYLHKFTDDEIYIYVTSSSTAGTSSWVPTTGVDTGTAIGGITATASSAGSAPAGGFLLGTGTVTGAGDTAVTRSFTVKMWVSSEVVSVIAADQTSTTHNYNTTDYAELYYTMRIGVTAAQAAA